MLNRLSPAVDAAAGAGHELHKVVLEGAVPDAVQHPLDVVQAGGHADPDGLAGQLVAGLLDSLHAADLFVLQRGHARAGELLHHGAQGGLHDAAGGAEDGGRAGGDAQHGIERPVGQVLEEQAGLGDHAAQLPGGEGHVHRHAAVGQPLLFPQYLVLLGGAGHDGHHEDVLGIDARLLGVVGLDQGAEHLLGGLAGGDVVEHVGGVLLQIPHPAGGAGGDEGEGAAAVEAA